MKPERWHVLTLDLGTPLPEIPPRADTAGTLVQIWKGSLPLGQLWLPREILPVRPAEFAREIAQAIAPSVGDRLFAHGFRAPLPVTGENPARDTPPDLASLVDLQTPISDLQIPVPELRSPIPPLRISVLVCTRSRPDALQKCLASLTRLDPAPDEILVVDNDPADPRTRAVAEKFPGITWLPEPAPGLSRARNAGLRYAQGEILAWTDDDTTVHPGWIGVVRAAFADPGIAGLTGLVLTGSLETDAQVHFERDVGGFQRGFRRFTLDARFFDEMKDRGVPVWLAGAGANMAFRRDVFEKLGPFDERLGAGAAGCSEDSEYWYRMLAAGQSIRYEPAAVVWHFHRVTKEDFLFQMEEYMRGHVAALLFQFEKYRHHGNLRRVFLSLPRYYWAITRQRLAGAARGTLGAELRGCLRGISYYLRNKS